MNRQDAERTVTEYLKPIFGFALKRCKSIEDAEDLSQEIVMRAFRTLLVREDVADVSRFIWTIAHNMLSNYYRDVAKSIIGVSVDEVAEWLADPNSNMEDGTDDDNRDSLRHLQGEIAYLSRLQRRIVIAYYFENRRQADIANELGIPLGTVKWHLFEAKKELKRGMNMTRKTSELKFNPIRFNSYGFCGKGGAKTAEEFFRGILSQNICYSVRNTAKSVNEIADDLGVSPVYVESEVEFLEEYGFLQALKDKYIINFIISEPTLELLIMQNDMYRQAAELFANDLYDELTGNGILENEGIRCCQEDGTVTMTESKPADRNFLLWSLIPYIAAWSGEDLQDKSISFEEVATIRPDGGYNIVHASVVPEEMVLPEDYVHMRNWNGPMWNGNGRHILWQIDSEWSKREDGRLSRYSEDAVRVLSLYEREQKERLSKDEYAWLAELGYVKTTGDYDRGFKSAWQIVILDNKEIQDKLLAVGERIKEKHKDTFAALKAPYVQAALESVPTHLRKVRAYELQMLFHSDGWFLIHCIMTLLKNGKMKIPTEGQKKALTTLIANV